MKRIAYIFFLNFCLFGQSYLTVPNNVFRISSHQSKMKYDLDRGEREFSLGGIGKMYFDPFTHNDSVRHSSNYDLYHVGSLHIDSIFARSDPIEGVDIFYQTNSTVENWMKQFNANYNYSLPVFGPQNIDTNLFLPPSGSFFENNKKNIVKQILKIDYGLSNEITFSALIPLIESHDFKQSIFDVSVGYIEGAQVLVDYHQNTKTIVKNFIDSNAYDNLPDSVAKTLKHIYDMFYKNSGDYSLNWVFHSQNDPINNLLVDERFIPPDMIDSSSVSLDELASYYYPLNKSGTGYDSNRQIGDIDIGVNVLLKGQPTWSSNEPNEAIYGQIFVSIPFGKTLSSFINSRANQFKEVAYGKGAYRWTLGVHGARLVKGKRITRVYFQGQFRFSMIGTLNTPIQIFSGGHTHPDSILQYVGNTYKYDMGNGLSVLAGGEVELVKNRFKILGEFSSNYKGMDNYISQSPSWDKWMEDYNGTMSNLDIKLEINVINSNSKNRIGPFSFDIYLGYKERLIANNTFQGWSSYVGITTFYQGW